MNPAGGSRSGRRQIRAAEARIAHALSGLACRSIGDPRGTPPAYARRHLAQHAHAGGVLDERTVPRELLPYLDITLLRPLLRTAAAEATGSGSVQARIWQVVRRVAHLWNFDQPEENALAIDMWAAAFRLPHQGTSARRAWDVRWAHWPVGVSEVLGRHEGSVSSVATVVLPDGRALAVSGGVDHRVRIWDLITGQAVGPALTGHTSEVLSVSTALLPDGRALAVSGSEENAPPGYDFDWRLNNTLLVWDLTTPHPTGTPLADASPRVTLVATAVPPDGRAIAVLNIPRGDYDAGLRWWDIGERAFLNAPSQPDWASAQVRAMATVALLGGGALVVAGTERDRWSDSAVVAWDLDSGDMIGEPLYHDAGVLTVAAALLPDSSLIVLSGDDGGTVRAWNLAAQRDLRTRSTGTSPVLAAATAVLPDGRALAVLGSRDGTVRVWDLVSGAMGAPLTGHNLPVVAAATALLPDGSALAVTGGADGTVRTWDLTSGQIPEEPATGPAGVVLAMASAVLPDGSGRAVIGGWDGLVEVRDLATGLPVGEPLTGHTDRIHVAKTVMLPDGRVVAVTTGVDRTVRLWDLATRRPVGEPIVAHRDTVYGLDTAVLPDGTAVAATASQAGGVLVWNLSTGRPLGPAMDGYPGLLHGGPYGTSAVALAVLPGGRTLVVTGGVNGGVLRWDLATGKRLDGVAAHREPVTCAATAVLPDGRAFSVTGSEDSTVVVWDLLLGGRSRTLTHHSAGVYAVATGALADGRAVAITAGMDGTVVVVDLVTLELAAPVLRIPGGAAGLSVTRAADGRVSVLVGGVRGILLATLG